MINELKSWLDFAIKNQDDLKKEYPPKLFPEWNKGYLEALMDTKKILEDGIFLGKKWDSSIAQLDFIDSNKQAKNNFQKTHGHDGIILKDVTHFCIPDPIEIEE